MIDLLTKHHSHTIGLRSNLLGAALAALVLSASPSEAQLRIELNIPEQQLHVYRADERIRSFPVSVGEPGHDTPQGEFQISHAEWNPSWKPPTSAWAKDRTYMPPGPKNPMGRVKLFFMPLYFLHGTPEEDKIGTPASKGCVRLRNRDTVELARLIHEEAAPHVSARQIDQILDQPTTTRAVRFRAGIPLSIRYDRFRVAGESVRMYPNLYGRGELHAEGVRQALMEAGHALDQVSADEIQRFLRAVSATDAPRTEPLRAFFPLLRARRVEASVARVAPQPGRMRLTDNRLAPLEAVGDPAERSR